MTRTNRRTIAVILLCAAILALSYGEAKASPSAYVRVRVSEKISYDGFDYSGRHWLKGLLIRFTESALILRMPKGRAEIIVPLDWITECQARRSEDEKWSDVNLPIRSLDDIESVAGASRETAAVSSGRGGGAPEPLKRQSYVGLGWGQMILPGNTTPLFDDLLLPNEEVIGTTMVFGTTSTPFGFGYGITYSGYKVSKRATNPGLELTVKQKYSVGVPSFYITYDTVLGDSHRNPIVGLRGGLSVAFIDSKFETHTPGVTDVGGFSFPTTDRAVVNESQVTAAPYLGVSALVPVGETDIIIFGLVEKSWFKHRYDGFDQDVELGPLLYGAGLAYRY
jgi:hypothetical protein